MKKRFVVAVCAGAALVASVAAGVARRGHGFDGPCCGCADCYGEHDEWGCCGGGTAVSTTLGDLIPGMPGELLRMRDEGSVFIATASGVSPDQFEAYVSECQEWGFDSPVRRVLRGSGSEVSRDFRSFIDLHNRTLSVMYNNEAQTLTVLLDASEHGTE